jgi:hypothetical protein
MNHTMKIDYYKNMINKLNDEINLINSKIITFVKETDKQDADDIIVSTLDSFFMEKNKLIQKVNSCQTEIKIIEANLKIYNGSSESDNVYCKWYSIFDD